jgi:hypothetical protein
MPMRDRQYIAALEQAIGKVGGPDGAAALLGMRRTTLLWLAITGRNAAQPRAPLRERYAFAESASVTTAAPSMMTSLIINLPAPER